MLSRYDGKRVKVETEDGLVLTGIAEAFPSGYGLHEFGCAEESLQIGGTLLFRSGIRRIEALPAREAPFDEPERLHERMGELLEGPYRIVDVLPEPVPADAGGQAFSVERYYLQPGRLAGLRRRQAEILLRLNCYDDMAASFDGCESWERNPDPETFAGRLAALSGNDFLRVVFESRRVMADVEPDGTGMTVYDPDTALSDRLEKLAAAEGFFVWSPPETGD